MKDLDAIIEELKNEALDVTEEGWLSDLSSERLEWDEGNKAIVIGDWIGSIDVGHLSGIVESLISDATKDLAASLEQAEQAVARVREMHRIDEYNECSHCMNGHDEGILYPCDTIRALDGEQA